MISVASFDNCFLRTSDIAHISDLPLFPCVGCDIYNLVLGSCAANALWLYQPSVAFTKSPIGIAVPVCFSLLACQEHFAILDLSFSVLVHMCHRSDLL